MYDFGTICKKRPVTEPIFHCKSSLEISVVVESRLVTMMLVSDLLRKKNILCHSCIVSIR